MPVRLRRLLAAAIVVVAAHWAPGIVAADGEASGIVVTPPRVKAGDEILIQGFALWTELELRADLIGRGGATRSLGPGLTGPDGSLNMTVRLPDDVPAGRYKVRVTNVNGEAAEAPVVVEAEFPIVSVASLVGAIVVAALVGLSAIRRRSAARVS